MLVSNVTDTALVFEGGGTRASYTSALAVALLEAGIHFDWVGGISAGASLTANYLSRDTWRTRTSFTDFVADPHFGNWRTFVRGRGLFDAQYIYEQSGLPGEALPFDWDTFAANPARLALGGFDAVTGETTYWRREDVTTFADLMLAVRASSSLPVVMPPVHRGEHVLVDGGLGESAGVPLPPARADGFSKFLVVLTQGRGYSKPAQRNEWFYRRHFRRYPALVQALHDRPARYNAVREEIFDLEAAGQAYVFAPKGMAVGNSERNVAELNRMYALGQEQAAEELPAIREFLGV